MDKFKDFIKEQFTIARTNMPQIEDTDAFKTFVLDNDISYRVNCTLVNHFKPMQAEGFSEYKIRNICMDMRKDPESVPYMKPIIVSEDGYVMDGHHRYLASIREQVKIPYIVVETTANKLLKLAYDFNTTNSD